MSDDNPEEIDIQEVVEALLNICAQSAEMQLDDDSRLAIYDMCDIVAEHHNIPRVDALLDGDAGALSSFYGEGVKAAVEGAITEKHNFKPELKLVVDNLEDMDDDGTIH
jgi:hypothetical protein